jgi:RNA polymerase sigma factor (sigma-70 family)
MTQAAPARMLSDAAVARRAAAGNRRAFAEIFERYHQDLYRYCAALLGNPEDAHDAVQNTMLKVLRALPGEERDLKLKPWLYRIAHNEAIDVIRARRGTDQIDAEALVDGGGPTQELEARDRLQELISDIAELPARQRGALVMREMSGLSYDQIGEALQTSPAVARQAIYEARLSLKQMSEGREMPCQEVMRAISDDDGRILRRRDIRSHLRRCEDCRAFRAEIADRRQEFAALAPLPAAVSAGILQGLLGGAAGGTNAAGGAAVGAAAGKALAGSAAIKSAAAVLAVSAVGIVAADRSGVIDLGVGDHRQRPAESAQPRARPEDRPAALTTRPQSVLESSGSRAGGRGRLERRQEVRDGSAVVPPRPGAGFAPPSSDPATGKGPQSPGRHTGRTKGAEHGNGQGKPGHPAKGKKASNAAPPGQTKSPGQAKHTGSSHAGGGSATKSHPTHPEHPSHPTKPHTAAAPETEAVPPSSSAPGNDKPGEPPAE